MSTYYGYAEREAEDNINWSTVGNDITKMLKEEVERRETLKTDIDKATRDYGETLANAPTGTHKGANDFITRFSDDATQAMLMQDRLLKSGQLKVKDYLLQRANLKDGTKNIFGVAKKFQAEFKRKAERMTKDESAKLEQTLFKMTEGFANFNNSGAYINPTNYSVSLAKKERVQDKDGNYVYQMSKKPQDFFTVSELNTFVSVDLDRFKTKEALDEIAKAAGARDQTITYKDVADGQFKTVTISDVTGELFKNLPADQQKLVVSYQDAIDSELNYILANKYNAASILTDYVGKGYDFTFDPKEASKNEKMILLEKDPSGSGIPKAVISPEQEKVIREELEKGIKFRLKQAYTEKGTQIREYKKNNKSNAQERQDKAASGQFDKFSVWVKEVITGDATTKKEALQKMAGRNLNIIKLFFREKDGVASIVAEMKDGSTPVILEDFEKASNEDIASTLLMSAVVPLVDSKYHAYFNELIDGTGVKGVKKKPVYEYLNVDADGNPLGPLYKEVSPDDYISSIPVEYKTIYAEDRVISIEDGTNKTAANVWNEKRAELEEETNTMIGTINKEGIKKFIDAFNKSYLAPFKSYTTQKRPEQNSLTVQISSIEPVESPNLSYGQDYSQALFKISNGDSFLISLDNATLNGIPKLVRYMEEKGRQQNRIKRKDLYEIFGDESYFTKYNKKYFEETKDTNTTATKQPFRKYDPKLDKSLQDYQAKKKQYEQNQ